MYVCICDHQKKEAAFVAITESKTKQQNVTLKQLQPTRHTVASEISTVQPDRTAQRQRER